MQREEIVKKLKEYFIARRQVLCVYLFDSQAQDKLRKKDDINLAVLVDKDVSERMFCDFRLSTLNDLSKLFHREIDVVIFNEAPCFSAYQILKYGIRAYEREDRFDHSLEVKALMEYFDFLPYRRRCEEAMLKHIKEAS